MATTDWDFGFGGSYRSLVTSKYISAPKSLQFYATASPNYDVVLSRSPICQNLPQGEVRNWIWQDQNQHYFAVFRNQAALGSSNYQNCYMLYNEAGALKLWRYQGGVGQQRGTTSATIPYNQWNEIRAVWWNGLTPGGADALSVVAYIRVGAIWTQLGGIIQDTAQTWKTSSINRCGFLHNVIGGHYGWFDDTEIWGP